jgi:hypothetical protein
VTINNRHPEDQRNEGEGNRTAARQYDEDTERFVKSGRVLDAAREARAAVDSDAALELAEAQRIGKSHAKEEDLAVKRDKSGK